MPLTGAWNLDSDGYWLLDDEGYWKLQNSDDECCCAEGCYYIAEACDCNTARGVTVVVNCDQAASFPDFFSGGLVFRHKGICFFVTPLSLTATEIPPGADLNDLTDIYPTCGLCCPPDQCFLICSACDCESGAPTVSVPCRSVSAAVIFEFGGFCYTVSPSSPQSPTVVGTEATIGVTYATCEECCNPVPCSNCDECASPITMTVTNLLPTGVVDVCSCYDGSFTMTLFRVGNCHWKTIEQPCSGGPTPPDTSGWICKNCSGDCPYYVKGEVTCGEDGIWRASVCAFTYEDLCEGNCSTPPCDSLPCPFCVPCSTSPCCTFTGPAGDCPPSGGWVADNSGCIQVGATISL